MKKKQNVSVTEAICNYAAALVEKVATFLKKKICVHALVYNIIMISRHRIL